MRGVLFPLRLRNGRLHPLHSCDRPASQSALSACRRGRPRKEPKVRQRACPTSEALDPKEIFKREADEAIADQTRGSGARRHRFIAGFSIVFGIAAQAVVHSLAEPHFGEFESPSARLPSRSGSYS